MPRLEGRESGAGEGSQALPIGRGPCTLSPSAATSSPLKMRPATPRNLGGPQDPPKPSALRKTRSPRPSRPPLCRVPFGSNQDASLPHTQEVEEFSFITQLSGLTDHLPVAMRLLVSTGEEEA